MTNETLGQRVSDVILRRLQLPNIAANILDSGAFAFSGLNVDAFRRNMAQGYSSYGRVPIPYPTYFGTAAGMVASAIDVASYSMAIDRHAFLSPDTQARAFTAAVSTNGQTLPYGLGWFVQTIKGVKLQWHYGWWIGNSSLIIRVPERDLVFVVLANTDGLSAGTRLGFGDLMSSPAARAFLDAFVFR
jgi:CubicO group peptidase (beta-lactamase class C family)